MRKLNDLKCPGCGKTKKDVFTETMDGREIVEGPDGEVVTAVCDQCGTELRKVLAHFNIGGKATRGQQECPDCSPESLVGTSFPPINNPITGDTLTLVVKSVKSVEERGPFRVLDCSCEMKRGFMPNKLN